MWRSKIPLMSGLDDTFNTTEPYNYRLYLKKGNNGLGYQAMVQHKSYNTNHTNFHFLTKLDTRTPRHSLIKDVDFKITPDGSNFGHLEELTN